jgi:hypothetical protein
MSFSEEILMAYADGELDAPLREQVEQAMRSDPQVAAAVERHRALRADVFAAFAGVLDEPLPARLQPRTPAAPAPDIPPVSPVSPVRVDVLAAQGARPLPARWSWPQWGAMAASLVVGVLAGVLGWQGTHAGADAAPFARRGDALVAQGDLADALSRQLAAEPGNGGVKVGVSFRARDGRYCRSFVLGAEAGLACRSGEQWQVPVLAEGESRQGAYRQAGSALPAAVLDAIDQRIAGPALDAQAERAARAGGWRP